jgi:hypothetical protein
VVAPYIHPNEIAGQEFLNVREAAAATTHRKKWNGQWSWIADFKVRVLGYLYRSRGKNSGLKSLKSHPRHWVYGSDPTYSEGLSQVFWESHQRELVDGSDPTYKQR